jgi:hypothetical protein
MMRIVAVIAMFALLEAFLIRGGGSVAVTGNAILLENGSNLLLENGSNLCLESSSAC